MQARLLEVCSSLRAQGFQPAQALKAEIGGGIYPCGFGHQDAAALIRVQATFLPQANGAIVVCYSISSIDAEGSRLVTDNLYIPFGGFYPELAGGAPPVAAVPAAPALARHRARLAQFAAVPFAGEPMADQHIPARAGPAQYRAGLPPPPSRAGRLGQDHPGGQISGVEGDLDFELPRAQRQVPVTGLRNSLAHSLCASALRYRHRWRRVCGGLLRPDPGSSVGEGGPPQRVASIAERNVLVFQPMLAEVAVNPRSPCCYPLRHFCRGVSVFQGA